jgi:hypothetical protein
MTTLSRTGRRRPEREPKRYTLRPCDGGCSLTLVGHSLAGALHEAGLGESVILTHQVEFHAKTAPEPLYPTSTTRGVLFQRAAIQALGEAVRGFKKKVGK